MRSLTVYQTSYHLMDMFPSFRIKTPLFFEKYPIFQSTRGYLLITFDLKDHRFHGVGTSSLFCEFYLRIIIGINKTMGFDKIKTNPNISGKVYQEIRPKTAKIARDCQRF